MSICTRWSQQLRDEDDDSIEQNLAEQYYNAVNVIDEDDEDEQDWSTDVRTMIDDARMR